MTPTTVTVHSETGTYRYYVSFTTGYVISHDPGNPHDSTEVLTTHPWSSHNGQWWEGPIPYEGP